MVESIKIILPIKVLSLLKSSLKTKVSGVLKTLLKIYNGTLF